MACWVPSVGIRQSLMLAVPRVGSTAWGEPGKQGHP